MTVLAKNSQYSALVQARKECTICAGLVNPAHCSSGVYDSGEIGPWTRWQGALDAELMLVGQDWGDVRYFEKYAGLDSPKNPTNLRLQELLAEAGFNVTSGSQDLDRGSIFLTNAILCLKSGGMGAPVRAAWFTECGRRFLRPQIELVRPRALVTLGARAYHAVCKAFDKRANTLRLAVEAPPEELFPGVHLYPVYHCSPRVLARARSLEVQRQDWRRIGEALGRRSVALDA